MNALARQMLRGRGVIRLGRVLTVDPGLGGTGLAYWPNLVRGGGRAEQPIWSHVLRSTRRDWIHRLVEITERFRDLMREKYAGAKVFVEFAHLFSGSARSRASAERGDLVKLGCLIGALISAAVGGSGYGCEIAWALPRDWKGQLTKRAVMTRIERRLGRLYRDHEADAVAMGLAIQGVLCKSD